MPHRNTLAALIYSVPILLLHLQRPAIGPRESVHRAAALPSVPAPASTKLAMMARSKLKGRKSGGSVAAAAERAASATATTTTTPGGKAGASAASSSSCSAAGVVFPSPGPERGAMARKHNDTKTASAPGAALKLGLILGDEEQPDFAEDDSDAGARGDVNTCPAGPALALHHGDAGYR